MSLMEEFEDREVDSTLNETYNGQVTTRTPYPNIVLVNNTVMIVVVDDGEQCVCVGGGGGGGDVRISNTHHLQLSMHATPIADVEIGFVSNETEVSEGEQAVLVVRVLAGQFPEGVVVNVFFQTIPGSATGRYSNNSPLYCSCRGGSSLVRQGSHEPPFLSATTHPLESPGSVEGTKLLHTVKSRDSPTFICY